MKLYYSRGACSLAPHIILHELNIACEYSAVDLKTKKTVAGEDYYQINPKGAVPFLQTDEGFSLSENAVIQQYLADRYQAYQLLPPLGDRNRYEVLMWLNYVATDIHKGFSPFFNAEIPSEIKEQIFKPALLNKFKYLDGILAGQQYLVGNQFTLPDSYLFTVLRWCRLCDIRLAEYPSLLRYFERMHQRPSVVTALREEGLL